MLYTDNTNIDDLTQGKAFHIQSVWTVKKNDTKILIYKYIHTGKKSLIEFI